MNKIGSADKCNLRTYNKIQVVIVDDHNEVLRSVYRAIATRHLPFTNIAMVHLDAHPDLGIPPDMAAETVYDKEQLLQLVDIESWIIPAVYAGHIDRVAWLKPWWADQIGNGVYGFTVGQCNCTGYIKVDSTLEYFLSDGTHAPKHTLNNQRRVQLNVETLLTSTFYEQHFACMDKMCIKKSSDQNSDQLSQAISESGDKNAVNSLHKNSARLDTNSSTITNSCDPKIKSKDNEWEMEVEMTNNKQTCESISDTESQSITQIHADKTVCLQCTYSNHDANIIGEKCQEINCESTDTKITGKLSEKTSTSTNDAKLSLTTLTHNLIDLKIRRHLRHMVNSYPYILDIDLDFFSTKNPFTDDYSPQQMKILSNMFEFTPPTDDSEESIAKCTEQRTRQLAELRALFTCFQKGELTEESHNRSLLEELVADLVFTNRDRIPIDFDLLYNAGLTCDTTGLPHHVSSMEEVGDMVVRLEYILRGLIHRPTIITMARSSRDEYCPVHQVDQIQDMVLSMLQSVYGEMDIDRQYENNSN